MYEAFAALAFLICVLLAVLMFIFSGIYVAAWIVGKMCVSIDKMLDESEKKE